MAGRKSKLSKVQKDLIAVLKTGATDKDACTHVGIGQATFYEWLAIGTAVVNGKTHARMPDDDAGKQQFAEFVDTVTRARLSAKVTAIKTIRVAMEPYTQKSKSVKTYVESRLRKDVDPKTGKPIEVPWDYKETTSTETVTYFNGDARIAIEYLKRRFGDEWGDRLEVDWRKELEDAGLNPDEQLDELTRQFEEHFRQGAERPDAGSADAGKGTTGH